MLFRSNSVRHKFPLRAAYFRQVLPHASRSFAKACTWLSHAQSTMPDKTPHGHAAGFPFHGSASPHCSGLTCRSSGSGLDCFRVSPVRASISVYLAATFPPAGVHGASQVPDVSLPACHGLRTPADLLILAISDDVVLPSGPLRPSASATTPISK